MTSLSLSWPTVVDWMEWTEGWVAPVAGIVDISMLDVFGSVLVCLAYRKHALSAAPRSWLESLIACTILQFGGTTLTALLLGQAPSWIVGNSGFPALLLVWWLTFFCPGDLFAKAMQLPGMVFLCDVGSAVSAGHSVTSWGVDKALFNAFHTNTAAYARSAMLLLLTGTLSSSGGGMLGETLGLMRSPSFTLAVSPSILRPAVRLHTPIRGFVLTCVYLLLLNPHGWFPWGVYVVSREEGHAVICIAQVVLAVWDEVLPKHNPTTALLDLLLRIFRVKDLQGGKAEGEKKTKKE